jgi:sarcosine oxidase subunit beta
MGRAVDIVPALAGAQVIRIWSGMDGQMPDHIPVIGFSSTTPRLVHAFGFSGHGFQLGPADHRGTHRGGAHHFADCTIFPPALR